MDLFGIKKRKAQKLQEEENRKKQAELEAKMRIKRKLSGMKQQSMKLDAYKASYIDKARKAKLDNNAHDYNLAKQALKACLTQKRLIDTMVTQFEITMEMNEMNKVIGGFVTGMQEIADDLKGITNAVDISKALATYDLAMAQNQSQYEALESFLEQAEASLTEFNGASNIQDDEIDRLIENQAMDSESEIGKNIEDKIAALKNKMN